MSNKDIDEFLQKSNINLGLQTPNVNLEMIKYDFRTSGIQYVNFNSNKSISDMDISDELFLNELILRESVLKVLDSIKNISKDKVTRICKQEIVGEIMPMFKYFNIEEKEHIKERLRNIFSAVEEEKYSEACLISFPVIDFFIKRIIESEEINSNYPYRRHKRDKVKEDFGHSKVCIFDDFWDFRNNLVHGSTFKEQKTDVLRTVYYVSYSISLFLDEKGIIDNNHYEKTKDVLAPFNNREKYISKNYKLLI